MEWLWDVSDLDHLRWHGPIVPHVPAHVQRPMAVRSSHNTRLRDYAISDRFNSVDHVDGSGPDSGPWVALAAVGGARGIVDGVSIEPGGLRSAEELFGLFGLQPPSRQPGRG